MIDQLNFLLKKNILFFLILSTGIAQSQDTLFYKKGTVQIVRVVETDPVNVRYKKLNNPDGPVYVVKFDVLSRIVYANGVIEYDRLAARDTTHKRSYKWYEGTTQVHVNVTDFLFGMFTILPERSIMNGMFSVRIPFSYGLIAAGIMDTLINLEEPFFTASRMDPKVLGYYDNGKIFSISGELYYYPPLKKSYKYFVGIAFGYGRANYATPVHPYDPSKPVWYAKDKSWNYSYFIKNGFAYNITPHFSLATTFGVGINRTFVPSYGTSYAHPSDYFSEPWRGVEAGLSAGVIF